MVRMMSTAAALAGVLSGAACGPATADAPPMRLRIATGSADGIYFRLGTELTKAYSERIRDVVPVTLATAASGYNVHAIQSDEAELAFTLGDITYLAYTRGTADLPEPHHGVRAIAVLYVNVTHILVPSDSPIAAIRDLRGRRVGVARSALPPRSGRSLTVDVIAEAHGIDAEQIASEWMTLPEMMTELRERRIEAGFFSSGYPVQAITEAASSFGLRLIPVDRAAMVPARTRYPFFKLTAIPAGTYPGQSQDVPAFGVDNLLVCRDDMDEALVYRLTRSFFESLPDLGRRIVAARLVDIERAPATPIPLHPGAARYYRERELLRW